MCKSEPKWFSHRLSAPHGEYLRFRRIAQDREISPSLAAQLNPIQSDGSFTWDPITTDLHMPQLNAVKMGKTKPILGLLAGHQIQTKDCQAGHSLSSYCYESLMSWQPAGRTVPTYSRSTRQLLMRNFSFRIKCGMGYRFLLLASLSHLFGSQRQYGRPWGGF